ncbi:MAG: nucleotide pyrophosphohydrolase [Bacilli bacterium]|nr:nucleotide pyrophosphohydrolase [Bacilli bacterium]
MTHDRSQDMTIKQMQQDVDNYISQFVEGYFSPLELMARMAEEVGELAREITHEYGPKKKKANEQPSSIAMELADCQFIITCFANSLGIDLEAAHHAMMAKFSTRDANRWTRKLPGE